ncbi:MAG: thioredoxin domain-containing protein [Kutzneria sp.]|nr:thioredoxin domain-containing protein [Kutzneria sp.]
MVDTQRKQRQQGKNKGSGSNAVAAARGASNDRRNLLIGVGAVLLVAIVVIVGITIKSNQIDQDKLAAIGAEHASSEYTAVLQDDSTVLAGNNNAKIKLDIYEDFICPVCGQFEQGDGAQVEKAIADGSIQVRYHMLNMLQPDGYSLRAANAAAAAAKAGKFADFHNSLYKHEPDENTTGYTNDQLINLGQRLGITGDQFTNEVKSGTYNSKVQADLDEAKKQRWFGGTPTVRSGDTTYDVLKDPQWLDKLLNGAKS